jgi:glycolate oxidase iron-sulfur subunit
MARKVRDVGAILAELGPVEAGGRLAARVTYHDPCHLAHFQGISAQPRALLRSIEGVDYREAAEADLCCGGAGTFALRERDLSLKVLDRKMESFARTGADTLVTACPSCLLQATGLGGRDSTSECCTRSRCSTKRTPGPKRGPRSGRRRGY